MAGIFLVCVQLLARYSTHVREKKEEETKARVLQEEEDVLYSCSSIHHFSSVTESLIFPPSTNYTIAFGSVTADWGVPSMPYPSIVFVASLLSVPILALAWLPPSTPR